MSSEITREEVLKIHLGGKIGIEVLSQLVNQHDLATIYTPGVALACGEIENNPDSSFRYTNRGNMVAVMSDGTAVLGLGDIGPLASVPVLEGKAALFSVFGGVGAWSVPLTNVRTEGETGKTDPEKFIETAKRIYAGYGGINLEDIAAPACFEIEDRLSEELDIPVFHDDQWGTAIITLAGVINYCLISEKKLENLKIVINGAGAAGIRIADMLMAEGATDITLVDSRGVISKSRAGLTGHKARLAKDTTDETLSDALKNADVFVGVSVAGCVSKDMIKSMASFPGIFAMANPTPEIMPSEVKDCLGDAPYIMATGRSDFPNQVNNVLGFPFIFRGALNVRSRKITMDMKRACALALAELARVKEIPESVKVAYGREFEFGPEYIIPVPFDPRLIDYVASRVAIASLKDGSSRYSRSLSETEITCLETGSITATITDIAYSSDVVHIGIEQNGETKFIPCNTPITLKAETETTLDPTTRPDIFIADATRLIGRECEITQDAICVK